jgi:hypothetical protein
MGRILIPLLIGALAIGSLCVLVLWLRSRGRVDWRSSADEVVTAQGSARCVIATRLLRALGDRGDSEGIVSAWARIEMPLLQALSDCPPDYKAELIGALDAAARACRHRETAKALVTMRNSLLA